jgi:predicted glycoside hydrolase/deacetylase ChbG (UPF0249 family)
MNSERTLIVNADDFGLSPAVNSGVIQAYEAGIVTSASLMVRAEASAEAAGYAKREEGLDLGLHIDLGEWVCRNGGWAPVYEYADLEDSRSIAAELDRQLGMFRDLVGRDPTHLDSHQHVHLRDSVRPVADDFAARLDVCLRHRSPDVQYCGRFYGQTAEGAHLPGTLTVGALINILSGIPPGITELVCHPAAGNDLKTTYRIERAHELHTLCSPLVRDAIVDQGLVLSSFARIPDHQKGNGS